MRLFSVFFGALLLALTAAQTTCTFDNCVSRIANLGTQIGRAYCFTYLANNAAGGSTVTTTQSTTVTTRVTRTTTVGPPVTQVFRTAVTSTATAIVTRRQIIGASYISSVLAACTSSSLRISSACVCYLQRPRSSLAGL
ncbi:hypothetical protein QBC43DRAFT_293449 [Cladorrhinum sp. PSN259]|nr:hypothetical protein QBC43DRAFT_293449 [Cladorrhinum sp. PSN259]